jgi:hypothetical protein
MAVKRVLPTRETDSAATVLPSRTGPYLEAYTLPLGGGDYGFADEGSYYHASNATLATGIAGHAAPVVADGVTKALLHLFNNGEKNIIPTYLFLEVTAAGTAGTLHYTTIYIDNAGATARASGGTAITPVNAKSNGDQTTGAVLYFGPVVTAMATPYKVGQQIVREVIPVVQDTVLMRFGAPSGHPHTGYTTAGTATVHVIQDFAPIVIGPGGNLNISQIRPSQSAAASYQFSFGYIER